MEGVPKQARGFPQNSAEPRGILWNSVESHGIPRHPVDHFLRNCAHKRTSSGIPRNLGLGLTAVGP